MLPFQLFSLLCGFKACPSTNMVEDIAIEETLKKYIEDMKLAGESLVQQANEAGGKDNISVILVRL